MTKETSYFRGDHEMFLDDQPWMDPTWIQLTKNEIKELVEAEGPDVLRSPVLNSVGVGDFNRVLDLLDDEALGYVQMTPLSLYEIGEFAKRFYLGSLGENIADSAAEHQDTRYPVFKGGMVDKLASTDMFQRLHGINQINIIDWYPMRNEQTRATHSINVAVYMLRALQTIYDKDKAKLIGRLKEDFLSDNIAIDGIDDESLIALTARLTAATGMLHDLFTPAGGDVVKRATGMNEEEDIDHLLSSGDTRIDEIRQVLADFGISGDFLKLVTSCIKGESESLIGDMIHPKAKTNALDIDQIAYTLWDAQAAGIIDRPILGRPLSNALDPGQKEKFMYGIRWAESNLGNSQPTSGTLRLRPAEVLPLSYIDPIDGYCLDEEGRLANDNPDILLATLALRLFLSTEMYRGTKMVGLDKDLETAFRDIIDSGRYDHIFNKENLLSVTTEEFHNQLKQIEDRPDLLLLMQDMSSGLRLRQYSSEVVDFDDRMENMEKVVRFKFSTGMESLVHVGSESVMTLSQYSNAVGDQESPDDPILGLISTLRARYNENTARVVHKKATSK